MRRKMDTHTSRKLHFQELGLDLLENKVHHSKERTITYTDFTFILYLCSISAFEGHGRNTVEAVGLYVFILIQRGQNYKIIMHLI